jgi:CBS domain-containing protein
MLNDASVKDYMSANVVTFSPVMDIQHAISQLIKKRISSAPVVDQTGDLVGMLTERDCMKIALSSSYYEEAAGKVLDYMQPVPTTVEADTSIIEVASLFSKVGHRSYPVMENNCLVGQISRHDVLKALKALWAHCPNC